MTLQFDARIEHPGFRVEADIGVGDAEVVAVLGPSGAGKSTLLRAVAGLTPISAGTISHDDQVWDSPAGRVHLPVHERPVALVFQDYRLFPHLSVRDNVAYPDRMRGVPARQRRDTALALLDAFDLAEFADRKPATLSGGQAQRVALARALASRPDVLLLDEPLSALDTRTRAAARGVLRRHLRDFPGPSLLVTHDPLEAMVMADRLVVLENGLVVQDGTPTDVASHPRTEYVAALVGLNLYAGTRDATTGLVTLRDGGSLTATAAQPDLPGGAALVAIRPSAITLTVDRPGAGSPRNVWPGVVRDVETIADRVRVDVAGSPDALVDVTAAAAAELHLHPGQQVWLSAKATEARAYSV